MLLSDLWDSSLIQVSHKSDSKKSHHVLTNKWRRAEEQRERKRAAARIKKRTL